MIQEIKAKYSCQEIISGLKSMGLKGEVIQSKILTKMNEFILDTADSWDTIWEKMVSVLVDFYIEKDIVDQLKENMIDTKEEDLRNLLTQENMRTNMKFVQDVREMLRNDFHHYKESLEGYVTNMKVVSPYEVALEGIKGGFCFSGHILNQHMEIAVMLELLSRLEALKSENQKQGKIELKVEYRPDLGSKAGTLETNKDKEDESEKLTSENKNKEKKYRRHYKETQTYYSHEENILYLMTNDESYKFNYFQFEEQLEHFLMRKKKQQNLFPLEIRIFISKVIESIKDDGGEKEKYFLKCEKARNGKYYLKFPFPMKQKIWKSMLDWDVLRLFAGYETGTNAGNKNKKILWVLRRYMSRTVWDVDEEYEFEKLLCLNLILKLYDYYTCDKTLKYYDFGYKLENENSVSFSETNDLECLERNIQSSVCDKICSLSSSYLRLRYADHLYHLRYFYTDKIHMFYQKAKDGKINKKKEFIYEEITCLKESKEIRRIEDKFQGSCLIAWNMLMKGEINSYKIGAERDKVIDLYRNEILDYLKKKYSHYFNIQGKEICSDLEKKGFFEKPDGMVYKEYMNSDTRKSPNIKVMRNIMDSVFQANCDKYVFYKEI